MVTTPDSFKEPKILLLSTSQEVRHTLPDNNVGRKLDIKTGWRNISKIQVSELSVYSATEAPASKRFARTVAECSDWKLLRPASVLHEDFDPSHDGCCGDLSPTDTCSHQSSRAFSGAQHTTGRRCLPCMWQANHLTKESKNCKCSSPMVMEIQE